MMVRVRFAPSPTGYLHIGSARTALFNWLFARHNEGKFLLRIEDTDVARSKKEYLDEILDSLRWLGLDRDEEPVYQSKRLDIYRTFAERLLNQEKAYKAENGAIIFKMPQEQISIDDLVHGRIEFDSSILKDLVLIKADGTPTYNFACVIDDAQMEISHVIRGDDHISNTPKQLVVYKALELKHPEFAHIPLILGKDRSRMSKRHGAASIREYRQQGFLPQALVNFITLLGWAPGEDREIMALEDIKKEFSLKDIRSANAVFDIDKLTWMNGQYIKEMSCEEFLDLLLPGLKNRGWVKEPINREWLLKVASLFRERARTLPDFFDQSEYIFVEEIKFDQKAVDKRLKKPKAPKVLEGITEKFSQLEDFNAKTAEEVCRELAQQMDVKAADIIHPVRVAVSGRMAGPGLFELLEVLGKETVAKRLELAKKLI